MATSKYSRLKGIKASVASRQSIFVYAPLAQQDRPGVVMGSDTITIDALGAIHINPNVTVPSEAIIHLSKSDDPPTDLAVGVMWFVADAM